MSSVFIPAPAEDVRHNFGLRWVRSITGGWFTYTIDGYTIREVVGMWCVFDSEDVFLAKFKTRAEAVDFWEFIS